MSNTYNTICVVGAAGFIGSHVVREFLSRDTVSKVHAVIHDLSAKNKYQHLVNLAENFYGKELALYEADICGENAQEYLQKAFSNCEAVCLLANPVNYLSEGTKRDLEKSVNAALNVLKACVAAGVRRCVVASATTALAYQGLGEGQPLDESYWNTESTLQWNSLSYIRVETEKAIHRFAAQHQEKLQVLVLVLSYVVGPSLGPSLSASNSAIILYPLLGKTRAIVSLSWSLVDVRDVAKAYVALSLDVPSSYLVSVNESSLAQGNPFASGRCYITLNRFICSGYTRSHRTIIETLRKRFSYYPLPSYSMDSWIGSGIVKGSALVKSAVSSTLENRNNEFVITHLDKILVVNNSKLSAAIGIRFSDVSTAILDAAESLIQWGHVERI